MMIAAEEGEKQRRTAFVEFNFSLLFKVQSFLLLKGVIKAWKLTRYIFTGSYVELLYFTVYCPIIKGQKSLVTAIESIKVILWNFKYIYLWGGGFP